MSQIDTRGAPPAVVAPSRAARRLLAAGVAAGPMFGVVVAVQAASRPGYDLKWHPLSLFSLGPYGWVQVANWPTPDRPTGRRST
ncbi:MAG TPA: hypothetical protein VGR06_29410 [Actinophytocola sp.]|jgi:hypothetical protein|uniref:hypothetical protein n=1 Tax=Actinophytocola sp. TaxID=1872138 RepID=UPI002E01E67E|nr:hypothetical protein [Actinophytocola sp.]